MDFDVFFLQFLNLFPIIFCNWYILKKYINSFHYTFLLVCVFINAHRTSSVNIFTENER